MNDSVNYDTLAAQAEGLLSGHTQHRIANAANLSALLFQELPGVNWVGFYFAENGGLVLGPFQGQPACVDIPWGKGVCGTAAATREIQRVDDVHAFEGHIACDTASASELVIPLVLEGDVIGVLDIDSPHTGRFSAGDESGLARVAEVYLASIS